MKLDNFIVRPHRRLVEKYSQPEAWAALTAEAIAELSHEVAGLPTELDPENEEARRFDLLALSFSLPSCGPSPTSRASATVSKRSPGFWRRRTRFR